MTTKDNVISLLNHLFGIGAVDERHKNFRIQFYNLMIEHEYDLSDSFLVYDSGDDMDVDSEIELMNKMADHIYLGTKNMEANGKFSDAVIKRWSVENLLRTRSANFQGSIQI